MVKRLWQSGFVILVSIHVLETLLRRRVVPTEGELPEHSVDLPYIGRAGGLVQLSVSAVGPLKCTDEFALTEIQILVVVSPGAHRAAAEVVEQDGFFDLWQPGEVEPHVVTPERVDAEDFVGDKDMRHDAGRVALHKISHSVLVKEAAVKRKTIELFFQHLHATKRQTPVKVG